MSSHRSFLYDAIFSGIVNQPSCGQAQNCFELLFDGFFKLESIWWLNMSSHRSFLYNAIFSEIVNQPSFDQAQYTVKNALTERYISYFCWYSLASFLARPAYCSSFFKLLQVSGNELESWLGSISLWVRSRWSDLVPEMSAPYNSSNF